jgi:hypothetical protein
VIEEEEEEEGKGRGGRWLRLIAWVESERG